MWLECSLGLFAVSTMTPQKVIWAQQKAIREYAKGTQGNSVHFCPIPHR